MLHIEQKLNRIYDERYSFDFSNWECDLLHPKANQALSCEARSRSSGEIVILAI